MKKKINIGIVGGSGFAGGELCRLLLNHGNVKKYTQHRVPSQNLREFIQIFFRQG